MRIDSRDRTNKEDDPGRSIIHFNQIPSDHVANIGLLSLNMVNFLDNVNVAQSTFFLGRDFGDLSGLSLSERTFSFEVQPAGSGSTVVTTSLGALNNTLGGWNLILTNVITNNIPGSSAVLTYDAFGRLIVTVDNGGKMRFLNAGTSRFMQLFLGMDLEGLSTPSSLVESFTTPSVFGRQEYAVTPGSYTAVSFMTQITTDIQAVLTAEGNGSTMVFTLNADSTVNVVVTGETFNFLGKGDANPLYEVIGFTSSDPSGLTAGPYNGPGKVDFSGLSELYLHCEQISNDLCMESRTGGVIPVHARIPIVAGFGSVINYEAPERHYWKTSLPSSFRSLEQMEFTVRDSRDNLVVLNADWIAMFDLDVRGV